MGLFTLLSFPSHLRGQAGSPHWPSASVEAVERWPWNFSIFHLRVTRIILPLKISIPDELHSVSAFHNISTEPRYKRILI